MAELLEVKADLSQLDRLGKLIGAAGKAAPAGIARAVNHTGDKAETAMTRALTVQTGLKRKVIVKALKKKRASASGSSTYSIASQGGNIALKYFAPRETRAGVSAAPLGHRQLYAGTFTKGGRFPHRKAISKYGGNVMHRDGGGRGPLHVVKSGVFIPEQMVTGATAEAFYGVVESDLPRRLEYELLRVLGG